MSHFPSIKVTFHNQINIKENIPSVNEGKKYDNTGASDTKVTKSEPVVKPIDPKNRN